jgi:hypothetical protein
MFKNNDKVVYKPYTENKKYKGHIISTKHSTIYPILVRFKDGQEISFTNSGKKDIDSLAKTLFKRK